MDRATILLAKWLSIIAAALFAGAMIQLVVQDTLGNYLADQKFQLLVLSGGVLLLLIVVLRVFAVVFGTGGHSHEHHDHDHDDGHDHAPSLWRLILLALPLMIIFMGVPAEGYSGQGLKNKLSQADLQALSAIGAATLPEGFQMKGEPRAANWKELIAAASDTRLRDFWQGRPVRIVGQYGSDARFNDRYRLMRVKITCCAADAVPLSINVLGKPDPNWRDGQWLEVTGAVDYIEVPSGGRVDVFPVIYKLEAKPTQPQPWLQ